MKFILRELPYSEPPIKLSLVEEGDGDIRLDADRGPLHAEVLRITTSGKVVRIIHQEVALESLGFQIEQDQLFTNKKVVKVV